MENHLPSICWKIFLFALSLTFLGLALFIIIDSLDDFFQNDFSLTCIPIYDYIGRSSVLLVFFYVSGVLGLYPLPEFCYHHPRFTWKWWQDVQFGSPTLPHGGLKLNGPPQESPNGLQDFKLHSPTQLDSSVRLNGPLREFPKGLQEFPKGLQESRSNTTNSAKVETEICPVTTSAFCDGSLIQAKAKLSSSSKQNEFGKGLPFLKNHRRGRTSDRNEMCLSDISMKYRTRDMGFYYLEQSYQGLCKPSLPSVSRQLTTQPSVLHRRSNSQSFSVKSVQRSNSQKTPAQNISKASASQNYLQNATKVSNFQNCLQNIPKVSIPQNIAIQNVLKKSNSQSVCVQRASSSFNKRFDSVGNAQFKLKASFG